MRAQILKELNKTWLILEGEEPVPTENYQTRMLMGNMIPSILKVRLQQLDGRSRLCFDITSRQSLEEVCQDEVIGAGQIRMILESCLRAAEEMQEYLLDIDQLIIEPEYIFTAAGEKRLYFCCFPDEKKDFRLQLTYLMEYLLPRLDHADPEAVSVGYHAYRSMMEDRFSMEAMRKSLFADTGKRKAGVKKTENNADHAVEFRKEEERKEEEDLFSEEETKNRGIAGALPVWAGAAAAAFLCLLFCTAWYLGLLPGVTLELLLAVMCAAAGAGMLLFLCIKRLPGKKAAVPYQEPERENDVTDISDFPGYETDEEERTEILWDRTGRQAHPPVLRSGDASRNDIVLNRNMIMIGKLKSAVDAVIPCPTVSRVHAKCRMQDGNCFLTDLHSKNGTFVNDVLLEGGTEVLLREGDRVRFAEAEYVYTCHFE